MTGVETLLAIVILGGGIYIGSKFFGKTAGSIEDTPIEEVQKIEEKKKEKVDIVEKKIEDINFQQLTNAQAATHATGEAIDRAKEKAIAGQDATREIQTAEDINEVAKTAIDLGLNQPVDPKLLRWFIDAIDKKNSEIEREREIGEKMLATKSIELSKSAERESKLIQEKAELQLKFDKLLEEAGKERDQWALENAAKAQKLDRIYFWIWVAVGVYGFALVAPLLSKIFPALAPIANVAGAVVAPAVQWGKSKADKLATDLVALQDQSKKFIETIDPNKVQEYKQHVKQWWENDTTAQGDVEEIKKKLRL